MNAPSENAPAAQKWPLPSAWELINPVTGTRHEARVPGCVHTDLRRAGLIPDPFWGSNERELQWIEEQPWVYRCEFARPANLRDCEVIELVAEGLDTLATVTLNGVEIGRSENMFVGHRFEVTRLLRDEANELVIRFESPMEYIRARRRPDDLPEWNDPVGGCSHIRKQQCSFGWDWGPRFATSGVYLPVYLHGWSTDRIERVRIRQRHEAGVVSLVVSAATARDGRGAGLRVTAFLDDEPVAAAAGSPGEVALTIARPHLWWPNGYGEQPLYRVCIELLDTNGRVVDVVERRVGLRTIVLDRRPDEFGESFRFVVNGRPIFAKGANWIPAHAFVSAADRALYDDLLSSAARAHMNMLRVWGGGIYESDTFYDLCDEKGLLVWQDFMFACALYPGTPEFVAGVRAEAEHQVKRLAHRACLALWCGNNEIEQMPQEITRTPERKAAYEEIFYRALPEAVAAHDGVTAYWPSSPHNPAGYEKGFNSEEAGDAHFWDVWHARHPVKAYENKRFRFCSEFGMQSYSSPEVAETYCRPEFFNVFGPEMENHQKNPAGNLIIFDYVSRLYRFPRDYAALAYLSQLNQAYCMKVGVEHFRRSMPRTMGALYWQLNDCWPVASWSSLEFGGRWKALHYEARRFFAPALVSAHVPGDEMAGKANQLVSTIGVVHIHTVFDGLVERDAEVAWSLVHLREGCLKTDGCPVRLVRDEAKRVLSLDFTDDMRRHGAANLYLRIELRAGAEVLSRQTVFLTAPKYLALESAPIDAEIGQLATGRFELALRSPVYQHAVQFHFSGVRYFAEDNFFDLFPGEVRRVRIETSSEISAEQLAARLGTMSLVDSYRSDGPERPRVTVTAAAANAGIRAEALIEPATV